MTAMTISDTERREVARRLRSVDMDDFSCYSAEFEGLYKAIGLYDGEEYAEQDWPERLADLIEPSCDRDALLALEDEMFEDATGLALISQLEKNEGLQDLQSTMAKALMDYARRIREALGVDDG